MVILNKQKSIDFHLLRIVTKEIKNKKNLTNKIQYIKFKSRNIRNISTTN